MRYISSIVVCSAIAVLSAVPAGAAQYSLDPMTPGVKYCPAPGADNSAFLHSYWAIDAQTGEMSKVTATDHPSVPAGYETNQQQEEVLFVAPNISVENRYVPYPGAAAQEPPAEFRRQIAEARPLQAPPPEYYSRPEPVAAPAYSPRPAVPSQNQMRRQASRPSPRQVAAPVREQYQQPQPTQVPQQTMAAAAPAKVAPVPGRQLEMKKVQNSLKNSNAKHGSKGRSEKQPWWRHIWRN